MTVAANQIPFVATLNYSQLTAALNVIGQRIRAIERTTNLLGSALNRLKIAAQFYITFRIFSAIYRGVDALTNAIPDLLRRGDEWLRMLDKLQDATGMTAEQVSKLAFVARYVGVDVDKLGRDLSYLARNVVENEENFKKFGISVRDETGRIKGSYEIFNEVRRALSTYGRQFISSAAAQRIFSEGGRELMDLLTLTDRQFQRLTGMAERYGFIMSQAAISGAEAWRRAQNLMQMQIDAIGARILGGVAPVLIALTSGITKSIQDNMGSIVNFVQRVVVVVAGFVGGLLGIEFNFAAINRRIIALANGLRQGSSSAGDYGRSMKEAAGGTKANTSAIDRQIDALDRQIARLDRIEDRRRARREYQELQQDIEQARRELSELRSEHLFESGMSLVEAELARQAHAADIIAGEKRLAEAKRKLRDWERQQELDAERDRLQRMRDALQDRLSDMTAAATKAATGMANAFQTIPQSIGKAFDKSAFKIDASLKRLLKDVQRMGEDTREALMTALFGEPTAVPRVGQRPPKTDLGGRRGDTMTEDTLFRGKSPKGWGVPFLPGGTTKSGPRTGGLIEALGNLVKILGDVARSLVDFVQMPIWKVLSDLFGGGGGAGGRSADLAGALLSQGKEPQQYIGDSLRAAFETAWNSSIIGSTLGQVGRESSKGGFSIAPGTAIGDIYDIGAGKVPEAIQKGLQGLGDMLGGALGGLLGEVGGGARPAGAAFKPETNVTGTPPMGWMPPNLGAAFDSATRWQAPPADNEDLFRRYLGRSSPIVESGEDTAGATWSVFGNTTPIADGNVGTSVNGWGVGGNIGTKVDAWGVGGNIGTKVDAWGVGQSIDTDLARISTGTKLGVEHWAFKKTGTIERWKAGRLPVMVSNTKGWNTIDKGAATVGKQNVMINILRDQIGKNLNYGGWSAAKTLYKMWYFGTKSTVPEFASGTRYVPETGPAILHRGEVVLNRSQATQAVGPSNITIQLDARATRDFLLGRPLNTSTMPMTGT